MPICFIFAKSSTNRTVLVKTKSKPGIIQTIPFCNVKTQNSNPKLYCFSQILKSKSFMNLSTWKLPAHHDVNPSASPTIEKLEDGRLCKEDTTVYLYLSINPNQQHWFASAIIKFKFTKPKHCWMQGRSQTLYLRGAKHTLKKFLTCNWMRLS